MNVLDVVETVVLLACLPLALTLIVMAFRPGRRATAALVVVLTGWFALTSATRIQAVGPVPGAAFAIGVPVAVGTVLVLRTRHGAGQVLLVSVASLVALHVTRLAGGGFVILGAQGRLSDPFASAAGWGDILSAVTAVPAAVMAARQAAGWRRAVLAWNVVGTLDFLSAIFFGFTSAPGSPLQLFTAAPGSTIVTTLPWRWIPFYFVPLYLVTHLAVFVHLHRTRSTTAAAPAPEQPVAA